MFKKKCRCGESEKNFKNDIGEFFIAECCIEAGYDYKGDMEGDEEISEEDLIVEAGLAGAAGLVSEKIEGEDQGDVGEDIVDADLDNDGDVDADDVQIAVDLEKMGQKELMEECDKKGLVYKSNESKAKLREMLKA